jgi:ParB family chromosome partitioning protein
MPQVTPTYRPIAAQIDKLVIDENRRAINLETIGQLVESIRKIGLRIPICIRAATAEEKAAGKGGRHVVTGAHRIAAFKKLERKYIPAILWERSREEAELWEIAENAHRLASRA